MRTLDADRKIVIALVEYLTCEDVGQPLGRRLAWPASWIVDDFVTPNKSSTNDGGVPMMNGALEKKVA
jgi:hypothetical protein